MISVEFKWEIEMLSIYVVDSTAEARNSIVSQYNSLILANTDESLFLPRVSVKPIALQELKFQAEPDICIVGDTLAKSELSDVSVVRKMLPKSIILVRLSKNNESLSMIEQLARMGVNDTISENVTAHEFFRKIILFARNTKKKNSGKLVLIDSGKGGLGCTSIVAALGQLLSEQGKKTVLVDLDFETQDLSRFLQIRPFINENLQVLLEQRRAVSEDSVEECLSVVWADQDKLKVMSPVSDSDIIYDPRANCTRTFLSVIEVLDESNDFVIVDVASARGPLLRALYRVADNCIFIVNNDPAALFASTDKVNRVKNMMGPGANLHVIQNIPNKWSLSTSSLKNELVSFANLDEEQWCSNSIKYSLQASRWPGSGFTIYEIAPRSVQDALDKLVVQAGLMPKSEQIKESFLSKIPLLKSNSDKILLEKTKEKIFAEDNKLLELPFSRHITLPKANEDSMPDIRNKDELFVEPSVVEEDQKNIFITRAQLTN
jgi:cellulose biosynthesis protein BcsQ